MLDLDTYSFDKTYNAVRAVKLEAHMIFTSSNQMFTDIDFVNCVILPQHRVCYKLQTDANTLQLDDSGDFRLLSVSESETTWMYVGDTKDIEKENKLIEQYLQGKMVIKCQIY